MELKKKPAEINTNIAVLIREERKRDPRSFFEKAYDSIIHDLKVLLERFSPIK